MYTGEWKRICKSVCTQDVQVVCFDNGKILAVLRTTSHSTLHVGQDIGGVGRCVGFKKKIRLFSKIILRFTVLKKNVKMLKIFKNFYFKPVQKKKSDLRLR